MSKPDLTTTEGVLEWVRDLIWERVSGEGDVRADFVYDAETAAYLAECVRECQRRSSGQTIEGDLIFLSSRAAENERLRQAFDQPELDDLGTADLLRDLRAAIKGDK